MASTVIVELVAGLYVITSSSFLHTSLLSSPYLKYVVLLMNSAAPVRSEPAGIQKPNYFVGQNLNVQKQSMTGLVI